jgi:hypothetical protein
MSPTSSAARAQREVKDAEPRLNGLLGAVRNTQTALNTVDGGEWFLSCVERAIDRVGQKKDAALTMGIDGGQLKNQLKGEGHLSARRLGLMPREFFEALIDELRIFYGLDDDAERLDRAIECVTRGMQQISAIARKGIK